MKPKKKITTTEIQSKPFEQSTFAPHPTKFTRYMRTNLIYQLFRFVVINIKMILMARRH
jgi:hypothetical protein